MLGKVKAYLKRVADEKVYDQKLLDVSEIKSQFVRSFVDGDLPKNLPKTIRYNFTVECNPNGVMTSEDNRREDDPEESIWMFLDNIRRLLVVEILYVKGWLEPLLKKSNELCYVDDYGDFRREKFNEELLEFIGRNGSLLMQSHYSEANVPRFFFDVSEKFCDVFFDGDLNNSPLCHKTPEDEFDDPLESQIYEEVRDILSSFTEVFDDSTLAVSLSENQQKYVLSLIDMFKDIGWSCDPCGVGGFDFQASLNGVTYLVKAALRSNDMVFKGDVEIFESYGDGNIVYITNVFASEEVGKYCESINVKLIQANEITDFLLSR